MKLKHNLIFTFLLLSGIPVYAQSLSTKTVFPWLLVLTIAFFLFASLLLWIVIKVNLMLKKAVTTIPKSLDLESYLRNLNTEEI